MMQRFFFLILIVFLPSISEGQASLNDINFSHLYNPKAEIEAMFDAYGLDNYVEVNVKLIKHQRKAAFSDYKVNLYTAESYSQKIDLISQTHIDSTMLDSTDFELNWKFKLPLEVSGDILVMEIQSKFSNINYYFETRTKPGRIILEDPLGKQQFEGWVLPGKYQVAGSQPLFGYFYNHEFPPALPPMPTNLDEPPRDMQIDSTFRLTPDTTFNLYRQGLYLIQKDTNTNRALSFRLEGKYFPKLVRLESLTEPLIYITTKEENEQLKRINGEKKKFDKFWLDVTNSPERAKNIIREYFDRVKYANRFFTHYKEGWKTDMGMIFIIFGPPDEVLKSEDDQIWTYLSNPQLPKLKFKFIKAENIFSTENYILIRDKKNAPIWYRAVDLWRKGRL